MKHPNRLMGIGALFLAGVGILGALALAPAPSGRSPGTAAAPNASETGSATVPAPDYVPGEVLVVFEPEASISARAQMHAAAGAVVLDRIANLNVERVRSVRGETTEGLMKRYAPNALVRYAQPNVIQHLTANPNDPRWLTGEQWALSTTTNDTDIDAPEAWSLQTGSSTITVAVIDSGIKYDHEDLAANIWQNTADGCGDGIDNDNNGKIDDCRGWDFWNSDNNPMDDLGHGTHVAGIVGAVGNNAKGVAGVAWTVRLMPLKAFNQSGTSTSMTVAHAIDYATDNAATMHVRVINYSAGGAIGSNHDPDNVVGDAVLRAQSAGILFVTAAGSPRSGNGVDEDDPQHPENRWWPCDFTYPNIICVTATNSADQLDIRMDWGASSVDLGAPGVGILSTMFTGTPIPNGDCGNGYFDPTGYGLCAGTSMATPHVSGVAALVLSARSTLSYAQVKTIILNTVEAKQPLGGKTVTGGRLNAFKAVQSAGDTTPPTAPTLSDARYDLLQGGAVLSWTASSDNIGVHHYDVLRSPTITTAYTVIGTSTTTTFVDTSVVTSPVTTYLFRVRAVDAAGNTSGNSNLEIATTKAFADDPLADYSSIRAIHISDLRTAVDAARAAANLAGYGYQDSVLGAGSAIRGVHITDLRTAVDQARSAMGLLTGGYTDTISAGVAIRKIHIAELRDRVR